MENVLCLCFFSLRVVYIQNESDDDKKMKLKTAHDKQTPRIASLYCSVF